MADLEAGTIKVDWGLLKRVLKALDWEGASVLYAIPVRGGGVEVATKLGVKTWKPEPEHRTGQSGTVPAKRKPRAKRKTGS